MITSRRRAMARDSFQNLVEGFFLEWLASTRNASAHTIASYRDAFASLIEWEHGARGVDPQGIGFDDFTAPVINEYLAHLTEERGLAASTANCRLAAFKSFCRYALYRCPERIDQLTRVIELPQRRASRKEVDFLTPEEVEWMIEACEPGSESELLVSLLYNTGARISELLNARVRDVGSTASGHRSLHVLGKGRKERTVPLWDDVAELLELHVAGSGLEDGDYLFAGRNVPHLTRSGARSRIEAVYKAACRSHPELAAKHVTPHTFRHSTAMALLAAKIDIGTVALWLGHESINTTHRYVVSDMVLKEEAIEKVRRNWRLKPKKRYRPSADVLDFLRGL